MQARLLFATVTSLEADIILIDEFLVVGDEYFQGKAWQRLTNFLKKGVSGVIVSHEWVSLLKLTQYSMILEPKKGLIYLGETYKTVRKYLNIPFKISDEISFLEKEILLNKDFIVNLDNGFSFSFKVKIFEKFNKDSFSISLAIEKYEIGIGWAFLCLTYSNIDVIKGKDIYNITIKIKDFNLMPGIISFLYF